MGPKVGGYIYIYNWERNIEFDPNDNKLSWDCDGERKLKDQRRVKPLLFLFILIKLLSDKEIRIPKIYKN